MAWRVTYLLQKLAVMFNMATTRRAEVWSFFDITLTVAGCASNSLKWAQRASLRALVECVEHPTSGFSSTPHGPLVKRIEHPTSRFSLVGDGRFLRGLRQHTQRRGTMWGDGNVAKVDIEACVRIATR